MSKTLKNSNLSQRSAIRSLLAISLTLSLAAFGCTTDRTLGNGDPVMTPGVRSSPTGSGSIGSESTSPSTAPEPAPQSLPQAMMSSSSARFDALPVVTPKKRLTPDEAAAIMAQHQSAPRVRVLGPAFPGASGRGYVSDGVVGQFVNPALITNPQITVNSTISSTPTPVIASGAGGTGAGGGAGISGAVSLGGTTTGGSVVGTTANAGLSVGGNVTTGTNVGGDDAAVIFNSTPVSPTASAAATLPAGAFAAGTGTLTPTAAAAINPGVTAASNLAPRTLATTTTNTGLTLGGNANTNNAVTGTTSVTANATTTATATSAARRTGTTGTVRIVTDANGRRTVTNQ